MEDIEFIEEVEKASDLVFVAIRFGTTHHRYKLNYVAALKLLDDAMLGKPVAMKVVGGIRVLNLAAADHVEIIPADKLTEEKIMEGTEWPLTKTDAEPSL